MLCSMQQYSCLQLEFAVAVLLYTDCKCTELVLATVVSTSSLVTLAGSVTAKGNRMDHLHNETW